MKEDSILEDKDESELEVEYYQDVFTILNEDSGLEYQLPRRQKWHAIFSVLLVLMPQQQRLETIRTRDCHGQHLQNV